MRRFPQRGQLGDLPYPIRREQFPGAEVDPGAGVVPDWYNNYTTSNFPFTLAASVSQKVLPANPLRSYLLVQNKDAATDMFIAFNTNANAYNGIIIIPRGNYEFIGGANGGAFVPAGDIYCFSTAAIDGVVVEGILPPYRPGL